MEVTVENHILCCGGVPMPADDPALKDYERKRMTILGINKQDKEIVIYTEKPLELGRKILFIGSSVYCKSEKGYRNYEFLPRFEAKAGENIVSTNKTKEGFSTYLWINPQETFLEDHRVGHILIFIEI